jgi:hypothetical protein
MHVRAITPPPLLICFVVTTYVQVKEELIMVGTSNPGNKTGTTFD